MNEPADWKLGVEEVVGNWGVSSEDVSAAGLLVGPLAPDHCNLQINENQHTATKKIKINKYISKGTKG